MAIERSWPGVLLAIVGAAATACAPPSGSNVPTDARSVADAAPDVAVGLPDAPSGDAMDATARLDTPPPPPPDAGAPEASAPDVSTSDAPATAPECAPGAVIDLNAVGTATGSITRYTAMVGSGPAMPTLAAPSCQSDLSHVTVFSYRARATATLRVSTNNPGTTFDTVAWALDRCAPAGAMELGCGDDDNRGVHESASTFTTANHVSAGSTVYIVVAAMGGSDAGTVDLSVSELTDVAAGGTCDPTGETTVCVPAPNECVTADGHSACEAPRYAESGLAPPGFLDACATGTHLALTSYDHGHATAGVPLPFAFRLFGDAVSSVWPSTNGYAVFDAAPTDSAGGDGAMPMREEGALVAPFWQNLALRSDSSAICTAVFGTAPNRQFVIEWLDAMPRGDTTTHVTFEAVLTEGTNTVDMVYQRLDPGSSPPEESDGSWSAIGLQSAAGVRFVAHDGSVDTMNAVRFTPAM